MPAETDWPSFVHPTVVGTFRGARASEWSGTDDSDSGGRVDPQLDEQVDVYTQWVTEWRRPVVLPPPPVREAGRSLRRVRQAVVMRVFERLAAYHRARPATEE